MSRSRAWRYDRHLAIMGSTQQGKSVLANQLLAEDDRFGVFFAPDPEDWFVGVTVRGADGMIDAMRRGARNVVIATDWRDPDATDETFADVVATLLDAGERFDLDVAVAIDEAHDLPHSPLNMLFKRGLKRGVVGKLVTQSPIAIPLEALRQTDYRAWVGPASNETLQYFRRKRLSAPEQWLDNPEHRYSVVDRQGEPVASGYADVDRYGPR